MKAICIDIGGSSVKSGVISDTVLTDHAISNVKTSPLETRDFSELKDVVLRAISAQMSSLRDEELSVGISTSGSVDLREVVVSAGHFNGYLNVDWKAIIDEAFERVNSVAVANDGRASAWGEYKVSATSEVTSHVHVVVGTGVGGGIVHRGELLIGDSGQAGYIGHLKITDADTVLCSCKKTGCVEALAAVPAICHGYASLSGRIGDAESNVTLDMVTGAALEGDGDALKALENSARSLGVGIGNVLNVLNASVVTIGGGVILASEQIEESLGQEFYFDSVLEGVEYASHRRVFSSARIIRAKLGNNSGLFGAGLLALAKTE